MRPLAPSRRPGQGPESDGVLHSSSGEELSRLLPEILRDTTRFREPSGADSEELGC